MDVKATVDKHSLIVGRGFLACLLIATLAGCSGLGVKPWDRDLLADPMMEIGSDGLRIAVDEHIYFSKEATSGGRGFGGGGCGCN